MEDLFKVLDATHQLASRQQHRTLLTVHHGSGEPLLPVAPALKLSCIPSVSAHQAVRLRIRHDACHIRGVAGADLLHVGDEQVQWWVVVDGVVGDVVARKGGEDGGPGDGVQFLVLVGALRLELVPGSGGAGACGCRSASAQRRGDFPGCAGMREGVT
jgi:hypothetical protein